MYQLIFFVKLQNIFFCYSMLSQDTQVHTYNEILRKSYILIVYIYTKTHFYMVISSLNNNYLCMGKPRT